MVYGNIAMPLRRFFIVYDFAHGTWCSCTIFIIPTLNNYLFISKNQINIVTANALIELLVGSVLIEIKILSLNNIIFPDSSA